MTACMSDGGTILALPMSLAVDLSLRPSMPTDVVFSVICSLPLVTDTDTEEEAADVDEDIDVAVAVALDPDRDAAP